MTQNRPLNFSNQDLRNRSFRGQDLTGADFRGSDIRGCDFTGALLREANFEGARAGLSRQRVHQLIARASGAAIAVTMAGAFLGVMGGNFGSIAGVLATGAVAVGMTKSERGIVAGVMAGVAAVMGCGGLIGVLAGEWLGGILLCFSSGGVFAFATLLFFQTIDQAEKSSRTSFRNANLTQAKLTQALMRDADFSGATGYSNGLYR